MLRYILCPCWHGRGFVNTCWGTFCVKSGMWRVRSAHVEIHFVSSQVWDRFVQHLLRYILFPRWHVWGLINTCWDTFCVLASMGSVWITYVEICFLSSLACEVFGQHMLRCIFCPPWHVMGLGNTCWELASMGAHGVAQVSALVCGMWLSMRVRNCMRMRERMYTCTCVYACAFPSLCACKCVWVRTQLCAFVCACGG